MPLKAKLPLSFDSCRFWGKSADMHWAFDNRPVRIVSPL